MISLFTILQCTINITINILYKIEALGSQFLILVHNHQYLYSPLTPTHTHTHSKKKVSTWGKFVGHLTTIHSQNDWFREDLCIRYWLQLHTFDKVIDDLNVRV